MATWGEILEEVRRPENRTSNGSPSPDTVRRRYLLALHELTGRSTILYGSSFLDDSSRQSAGLAVELGDIQGFMNACHGLNGPGLDLILTTPGGSAEAAESIIHYLRQRFEHIRAIVPVAAMSAGTMLAMGCDEIVLGRHSQVGPIDPQLSVSTPEGIRRSPAWEILQQFELAKTQCAANPTALAAWAPILRTYSPGLLRQCETARQLAERLVGEWLSRYMFRDDSDGKAKGESIAEWLSDYSSFQSHGRRISYEDLEAKGLRVQRLEDDQALQDAVLSVHHAASITFSSTSAVKIIENHVGRAYIKLEGHAVIPAMPVTGTAPQRSGQSPATNRAERRRNKGRS